MYAVYSCYHLPRVGFIEHGIRHRVYRHAAGKRGASVSIAYSSLLWGCRSQEATIPPRSDHAIPPRSDHTCTPLHPRIKTRSI